MYNEYFGFSETPFSIAPDPRYLYMSEQHREALAHLLYGFNSDGGFVLLTGEVGTGKTTVCRGLLEQVPENSAIAFILNPKLTVEELLATICDEFGISYPEGNSSIKVFTDLINEFLINAHASGKKAVLIIDEAQNLSIDVLEQLRLLTNLETNQFKLLQIIMLGQPELRDKLARPELLQLSQRIIARYHLGPLSRSDLQEYVKHRLSVAGLQKELFPDSTIKKLYKLSSGVPRLINIICDRALLGTFVQGKDKVNKSTLIKAAREVFGEIEEGESSSRVFSWSLALIVIVVFGVVVGSTYYNDNTLIHETVSSVETPFSPSLNPSLNPEPNPELTDPPEQDELIWKDLEAPGDSKKTAFKELSRLWGIPTDEVDEDYCSFAESYGLKCLSGLSSVNSLIDINRPAVLKIFDDNGQEYFATLTSLESHTATLKIGEKSKKVSVEEIKAHWLGDFTLFWRPPGEFLGDMALGDSGSAVQWLYNSLSIIQDWEPAEEGKSNYDNDLVQKVKKFQIAEGLVPDGIAGTKTIIHINSAIDSNVPLLMTEKDN
jgi:general secretion pathway protein A